MALVAPYKLELHKMDVNSLSKWRTLRGSLYGPTESFFMIEKVKWCVNIRSQYVDWWHQKCDNKLY